MSSQPDFQYATVFDLDDTLYPELDFARSGMVAVGDFLARELGLVGATQHLLDGLARGVRHNNFDELLATIVEPPQWLLPRLVEVYRDHTPTLRLEEGSKAALVAARRLGAVALITDGPADVQRRKVTALGIGDMFDCCVFCDDLETSKPDARVYEAVERRVAATEYCYIADNPEKDFVEARRRGWKTIRVNRPDAMYSRAQPSSEHAAEIDVDALLDAFGHWP